MVEGNRSRQLTEQQIASVDSQIASPSQRAEVIWNHLRSTLPDATNWDVLCFAAEFMGMMSQEYLWLEDAAKHSARLVYMSHYLFPEKIDASTGLKRRGDSEPVEPRVIDKWRVSGGESKGWSARPDGPRRLIDGRNQDGPTRLYVPADQDSAREVSGSETTRTDGSGADSDSPQG